MHNRARLPSLGDAVAHDATSELRWHQGRACDAGNCVEVATSGDEVLLRSSLSPQVVLTVSRGEWREFLGGAKDGLFDNV